MVKSNDRFAAVRGQFAGTQHGPYCDVASRGLLSNESRAALEQHLEQATLGIIDKSALFAAASKTRQRFASLIGADARNVAYTRNITDGIAAFAASLEWRPGDSVVLCEELEHPANIYPWYGLGRKFGITVKNVAQRDGVVPIQRILDTIDESTRVVAVSAVSFAPGFRIPLVELAAECRERGVLLVVDAAQSIGVVETDVSSLNVDVLVASTQKGLMALYGLGFLYVRPELAETLKPTYLSRFGVAQDGHEASLGDPATARYASGAQRFDVGNFNFPAAIAVGPAIELLLALGPSAVQEHVFGIARYFTNRMLDIGLPVYGGQSNEQSSHIVTVGGKLGSEHDVAGDLEMSKLYEHLVANGVRLSIRRDLLRFSFHIYNNSDDADEVVRLAEQWLRRRSSSKRAPANA
ncbi:aminotransferase class V-fold PLP-dependent enzyme [Bradyrhizobium sp. RDM4]|uniref:aminotransferase class V-fold PLP-dependent enzyme n=1 Tax=Bradyrhizobium sp. RDM4 TaxID=3378765 RepID=UPI0038FCAF89